MKRILNLVIALVICGNLFSQTPLSYRFRKPVAVNATTWKFLRVAPGVDAVITVLNTQNASVDKIDDSSIYAYAWQPFIKFGNGANKGSDTSFVEFNIAFQNSSDGSPSVQKTLAMTVVDCDGDGNNSYRELVKVSLPATASLIVGSTLVEWTGTHLLNVVSGNNTYSIDTTIYAAMTQINFNNISSYNIRVGVVGKVTGNTVRQSSFYFKPFTAFSQPLPVSLLNFDVKLDNSANAELSWSTTSEENLDRFEICRSDDGLNFYPIGSIKANSTNSQVLMDYSYTDFNIGNKDAFYRLKLIDNAGNFTLSSTSLLKLVAPQNPVTMSIYPNPVVDYINLNLNSNDETGVKVEILDAFGKEVHCLINPDISAGHSLMIDVKDLESGIYIINILNTDGSSTSGKFIKR